MSNVGQQLRQAREAKSITIQQVAEATKIRSDHIEALEQGNFDVFPAPVYIRGFVRTYSTFLKLDTPKIVQELSGELAKSEKHHEHPPLTPKQKGSLNWAMYQLSRINWRIAMILLIVAVILIVGLASWHARSTDAEAPKTDVGSGMYQPKNANNAEFLPLPKPQKK